MSAIDTGSVVRIPLRPQIVALIDASDWERGSSCEFSDGFIWTGRPCDVRWKAMPKPHTIYVICTLPDYRELRLHRVVMDAKRDQLIDHRNGNGLINQRYNLRATTPAGNAANRTAQGIGSSRFKGVSFHRATGKFSAQVRHDHKKLHLGLFDSEEAAARAYDAAAIRLFGEFARLNFPADTPVACG